jgi:hypothetical protein
MKSFYNYPFNPFKLKLSDIEAVYETEKNVPDKKG